MEFSAKSVYGPSINGKNHVGGKWKASSATFESRNPARLEDLVGTFPDSSLEDVRAACKAAGAAYQSWRRVPAPVRGALIGKIGDLVETHRAALEKLVTREIGKTAKEAFGEVQEVIDTCRFFQSEGRRLYGQTVPSEMPNKELMTYRRPLGVVGMITAGNFPMAVPSWKLIPALISGNTVIWKPSEDAPGCAAAMLEVFVAAGLPDGVLNVVFGGREAGKALVGMMDEGLVQKFAFTGSSAVGREIGAVAGRNLVSPSLELGGKNPLVVMRDADLENAVSGAVWAAFGTGGQRCTSAGNIILDAPIAEQFTTMFMERVEALQIGDPLAHPGVTYGPFMSDRFMDKWLEHLDWGGQEGAKKLYGEGRITPDSKPPGFLGDPSAGMFGWPTVWGGVTPDMKLFQTEIFGPTINLVTVNGLEEAIQAANAAPYGLSSAIYTNNHGWAFRFKEQIEAGMTSINNSTTGAEAHLPFGGTKSSGNTSRESGIWVLESYTRWQAVNDDHAGALQLAQMDTVDLRSEKPLNLEALLG